MVQISLDRSEDAAESWAENAGLPWLTVMPDDVKKSDLSQYHKTGGVPCYVLVDGEGEIVVKGSAGATASFAKIKELK